MSENEKPTCPKCGAKQVHLHSFWGQAGFACGSQIDHDGTFHYFSLNKNDCLLAQLAALQSENAELRDKLTEATPFMEAVKKRHNGYDEEARRVMEMDEPETPEQALDDLQSEHDAIVDICCSKLAAAEAEVARLRAGIEAAQKRCQQNRDSNAETIAPALAFFYADVMALLSPATKGADDAR